MKYLIFLMMLIANPVFAANLFEPPTEDLTLKILNQIFGGLINGGNDAFGGAMPIYTGAILAIGGILAAYTVLAGTLNTAHDGEMLGKKFSSVWIPIRYSLGTALVIPISAGGYCGMQVIVMWAITQGIGLGGSIWSAYMDNPTQMANTTISTTTRTEILKLAENAYVASACVHGYSKFIDNSDEVLGLKNKYVFQKTTNSQGNFSYGYQGGVVANNICGFVNDSSNQVKNVNSSIPDSMNTTSTNPGYLGNLDGVFKTVDITPLNAVKKKALNNLIERTDALAIQSLNDPNVKTNAGAYYQSIENIANAYADEIESGSKAIKQPEEVRKQEFGWMLAGAYYPMIISSNDAINQAVNSIPESRASRTLSFNSITDSDVAQYLVANTVLNASNEKIRTGATPDQNSDGISGGDDTGSGTSAYIGNQLAKYVSTIDLRNLNSDTRHPTIIVHEMGVRMIQSFVAIAVLNATANFGAAFTKELATGDVATVTTLGGAKAVAATSSGVLAALSAITGFMLIPLTALLVIGFVCAYIIPYIPYIFWIACIIGFLIQATIALIVAPLWAVMHLHPNGDDLTGRGGDGYTLLLGLLLRPAFLIFGLIASMVFSSILGEYLNKTFFSVMAFSGANLDGWFSFITAIFGGGLFAVVDFFLLKNTYQLMYLIPDKALAWIGGGKEALGSYAQEMTGSIEKSGGSATSGLIGGFAGGMAVKNAGNGVGKAIGGLMNKDKIATPHITTENVDKVNSSFNEKFGSEASDKKEKALGFNVPNGFTEQSKSASYDMSLNSVKNAKGSDGVESYQNEVIKYAENGNILNDKAFRNIAKSIIDEPLA